MDDTLPWKYGCDCFVIDSIVAMRADVPCANIDDVVPVSCSSQLHAVRYVALRYAILFKAHPYAEVVLDFDQVQPPRVDALLLRIEGRVPHNAHHRRNAAVNNVDLVSDSSRTFYADVLVFELSAPNRRDPHDILPLHSDGRPDLSEVQAEFGAVSHLSHQIHYLPGVVYFYGGQLLH